MHSKTRTHVIFTINILIGIVLSCTSVTAQGNKPMVRLAVIEIDSTEIDQYNKLLKEEIQASILNEPGVITLYAVAEKEKPQRIIIFETYADSIHYRAHLTTPHFKKYKQETLKLVRHLELIETEPIVYLRKKAPSNPPGPESFVRLIKLEISIASIGNFDKFSQNVMVSGTEQSGTLGIYAVVEKLNPTHINILEIYASREACEAQAKAPQSIPYIDKSDLTVKSIQVIDVNPILLGAKPK